MNLRKKDKMFKYVILGLLLIGITVGYAVLTISDNISGISKIKNVNWDIYFDNIVVSNGSVPIVVENEDRAALIDSNDNTKVTFAVTLDKPGDFYEFSVDAVNNGSIDAMVDSVVSKLNNQVISTLPEYLKYSVTMADGSTISENHLLAANTTETYKVRIEYDRDINNDQVVSDEVSLSFDFTINYRQADNSAVELVDYQVIHKYQNLDLTTYTEVVENLKAADSSSVTPNVSSRVGFTSPSTQTITITSGGNNTVTYIYTRNSYHFSITDRTYIDSTSTPDGDYLFETEITVKALERENYLFKWSDNDTNLERTITLTSDLELTPIYTENLYRVEFEAGEGNCTIEYFNVIPGNSIGELPNATREGYYLDGWYTSSTDGIKVDSSYTPNGSGALYARWKKSVASMNITNSSIEVEVASNETIIITNANEIEEDYTFASEDSTIASVNSLGEVTGVSVGTTTISITGENSSDVKTVSVEVVQGAPTTYHIILDANGGTVNPGSIDVNAQSQIGTIPTPVRENYTFAGWFTSLQDGIEVDGTYVPEEDGSLFAKWNKIICRRASSLHTEECGRTTDGCGAAGYTLTGSKGTTTITYGNLGTGNFAVGNAYNCDVNDDGIYNDTNERFYYLAPRGDNAVLAFYSFFEGQAGINNANIFSYADVPNKLPTTEQWNGLNVSFDGKAARIAYLSEIEYACGITIGSAVNGELDNCVFLLENSRFKDSNTGRTAYWLEYTNSKYYRVYTTNRNVGVVQSTSNNAVKPIIEVGVNYIDNSVDASSLATVSFDSRGGEEVRDIKVIKNTAIGELPTPTKLDSTFAGWYTDNVNFDVEVTSSTIISDDITLYAKWDELEGVAAVNGVGYQSLATAITNVPINTKTTVLLLDDATENISIPSNKNVVLDLNNHSITYDDGTVITNKGVLEIKNGTVNCAAGSGAINNDSTGTLEVNNVTVNATGTRQALYNNGGSTTITNDSILKSSSPERATLHNLGNGDVTILSGTIISYNQQAIKNEAGTLTIGYDDGYVDENSIVLQGATYAVTGVSYSFFDGILKGIDAAVEDENLMTIDLNSEIIRDTELIGEDTYNTLYLNMLINKYRIVFHPNGGQFVTGTSSKLIDAESAVGTLPTVSNGIYTFDGWYTGLTDGVLIDENVIPTASITYYAHWSYVPSNEPVSFNMVNDPMSVYYQNIATWKLDEATFQTNMTTNFDNYNCKCTDNTCNTAGTVLCDKPKAFDTTLGEELNVYLYDSVNETKGGLVNYTDSSTGIIHNMIPGVTYYWELASNPNVYGLVTPQAYRRLIDIDGVRNVRDLGGLEVDSDNDGVADGYLKYGKLFRGEKLSTSQSAVTSLENLGVTEEVDLRSSSERGSNEVQLSNFKQREIKHYQIDREHYLSNYNLVRSVLIEVMQDVIDGNNIYFHCRIGADRTGTLAYILEGLLQVKDEERLQDYDMSTFFGLINRNRYYSYDATSSVSKTEKFVYMYNFMKTSAEIYDWFMEGSTNISQDTQLINNFRTAMINYS